MNSQTQYKFVGLFLVVLVAVVVATLFTIYDPVLRGKPKTSSAPKTALVVYTDGGFNPSFISVAENAVVSFRNDSSQPFQPMSDHGYGYRTGGEFIPEHC